MDIKNEDNKPIHLHTFTGAGGFGNIRQTILGNYNATGGLIGIGDMGTTLVPFNPNYLLHSHRTGNTDVYHQFTNDNTGTNATNGLQLGLRYDNTQAWSIAEFRHYMNAPMTFWTNNLERMTLHQSGEVSIGTYQGFPNPVPASAATLNVHGHPSQLVNFPGWHAAIKVSNHGAIVFDNDGVGTTKHYFMAHASSTPSGHTYYGLLSAIDGTAAPKYIYKVHSFQAAPNDAAEGTHQFGTGIYLWPINSGNPLDDHYRPLLLQDVPPLFSATEPDADVWLSNIGLFQSRPLRGTTPVFLLSNTDEGIVLANQAGVFHTKLRFTGLTSDVLLGNGTWGNVGSGFGNCSHPSGHPILQDDVGMLLNDHNVYFGGQPSDDGFGNGINAVGIGACM